MMIRDRREWSKTNYRFNPHKRRKFLTRQTAGANALSLYFKGSLTRGFRLQAFFMNQCPPGPQVEPFWIFSKIRGDIRELMFITGVNNTGDKLFSGVNDTGEKFIAGVNNTGD